MSAVEEAVGALYETLGLDPNQMPVDGHVAMEIDDFGQLHIETHGEELLIYLRRAIDVADDRYEVQLAALDAVHYHHVLPFPVQVATHGTALVFLARFSRQSVDAASLERAFELLGELQDTARAS